MTHPYTPSANRHPAMPDYDLTEADCEGSGRVVRLGPDPWLPWTCPGCGRHDQDGAPQVCADCGIKNWGTM